MEAILEFIFNSDKFVNVLLTAIAAAADLAALVSFVRSKEKKGVKLFVVIFFTAVFLILLLSVFVRVIPDLTGDTYEEARTEIIEQEFTLDDEDFSEEMIVVDQHPEAGHLALSRSRIELEYKSAAELKEEENKKEAEQLRENSNTLIDVACTFRDTLIKVYNTDNDLLSCIGPMIQNPDIQEAVLTCEGGSPWFNEYEIVNNFTELQKGNSCVFRDIPSGRYMFRCKVEGYQPFELSGNMEISADTLTAENTRTQTISLTSDSARQFSPYTFVFLDEGYNEITGEVNFTIYPDGRNEPGSSIMSESSDFYITAQSNISCPIGLEIAGTQYEGILELNTPGTVFLKIENEGTIRQIPYEEYFNNSHTPG